MTNKTAKRLVSALLATALSYAAISAVATFKAQAAVLTYNFSVAGSSGGFFKVDSASFQQQENSSDSKHQFALISEGQFNFVDPFSNPKPYSLVGSKVLFYDGKIGALLASGGGRIVEAGDPRGGAISFDRRLFWKFFGYTHGYSPSLYATSLATLIHEVLITPRSGSQLIERKIFRLNQDVSYTLVNETNIDGAESVPEPITMAGTALAIAGFAAFKNRRRNVIIDAS
jgi:hypothetical protein